VIFVDSNAQRLLERCVADDERLVTDAEVLQEILHRYTAIGRRDAIGPAFEALLAVVDEVFPIELRDVERSRDVLLATPKLSARDALHVSVMERRSVGRVLSFDAGFDGLPGVVRIV
jgi:predicted nucleic acid-binding protein